MQALSTVEVPIHSEGVFEPGSQETGILPFYFKWELKILRRVVFLGIVLSLVAIGLNIWTLSLKDNAIDSPGIVPGYEANGRLRHSNIVSKIAFGSCTGYDYRPQPIWKSGVIPAEPDAWIWTGDFVYMDHIVADCSVVNCSCAKEDLLTMTSCHAGDYNLAVERVESQLAHVDYQAFLESMCPNYEDHGIFPPTGPDPSICPRMIFGVWDDHDFDWNDGTRWLPGKYTAKQIFLDGIGVPQSSPRRNRVRGINHVYTLNSHVPTQEIDIVLLDLRWFRDTKPCEARREWCTSVLADGTPGKGFDWCTLFFKTCCPKDDEFKRICALMKKNKDPNYEEACNPRNPEFGVRPFVAEGDKFIPSFVNKFVEPHFCDMIGIQQRKWLREKLERRSTSDIVIVVSSSGVFWQQNYPNMSSGGDDWDTYPIAQENFLYLLTDESFGCTAVIIGDLHVGDIKVLTHFKSGEEFARPLPQILASGMTETTANGQGCNSWTRDTSGFRIGGECNFISNPNFGLFTVDWRKGLIDFEIRDENSRVNISLSVNYRTREIIE